MDFINVPENHVVTEEEIFDFYCKVNDKKQTVSVYCLTTKELNRIIKENEKRKM